MGIYLDNAATTPLDPEVFEAMKPYMLEHFGNPSSIHSYGRKVRAAIESARKQIAALMQCTPGEIIFTSGGTEADNTIIHCAVQTFGLTNIITSHLEHHAVSHTIEAIGKSGQVKVHYLDNDAQGNIDLAQLATLLKAYPSALVSLMHANNEIGTLLDIKSVADLCVEHNAYFHSDTVQTVGHYQHNLATVPVHGITAAAHKFHGPKGVGFMFLRKEKKITPYVHGGGQERNMRGGTENVYGIIGLAKALEIAHRDMDAHISHIKSLKQYMIEKLVENIPDIRFNGASSDLDKSLYTVLNVSLPPSDENSMLLFNLDLKGVSASGGSACSSGALEGSHVLTALQGDSGRAAVRFSFSKYNTREEIDSAVEALKSVIAVNA